MLPSIKKCASYSLKGHIQEKLLDWLPKPISQAGNQAAFCRLFSCMYDIQQHAWFKMKWTFMLFLFSFFKETLHHSPLLATRKNAAFKLWSCQLWCFDSLLFYQQWEASALCWEEQNVQNAGCFLQASDLIIYTEDCAYYPHIWLTSFTLQIKNPFELNSTILRSFHPPSVVSGLRVGVMYWGAVDAFKLQMRLEMKYARLSATGSGVPQQSMYQQTSCRQESLNHDLFFLSLACLHLWSEFFFPSRQIARVRMPSVIQ